MKPTHAPRLALAALACISWACIAQAPPTARQQIEEHSRKAQEYLQQKRPDLAIPELRSLLALDPENADAHGNLGVLLFFKGDCAAAVPELHTAVASQSGLWRIQFLLGMCERKLGDNAAARTDLENAMPHLEDAKMRLEAGMQLVDIDVNSGNLSRASSLVDQLRAENPTNVAVIYMAYRIHTELAADAMLSLSMVDPNSAQMHEIMAHETMRYGDPSGAIAQYRAAIAMNPNLSDAHFELAEILNDAANLDQRKDAINEYRLASKLNPSDAKSRSRIGDIELEAGNPQQAYEDFSAAIKLAPTDVDARLGLVRTLLELNRGAEAIPLLEQILQSEPENSEAHYILSRAYWQQGRKDDSRREMDLFKKYKAIKDKLREMYKTMRLTPSEIPADHTGGDDSFKEK